MNKKVKIFQIVFNDPSKTFYCSGDKVAGKIVVEVNEITRVTAIRVLGVGCAKVDYSKGKQRCRQEIDYLKYEEVVHLDDHPAGKRTSTPTHPSIINRRLQEGTSVTTLVRLHGYHCVTRTSVLSSMS